jgi:glycine cleavage system H protein
VEDLRFSKDHLWVRVEGRLARVGLSERGQSELGVVQSVDLPEIGDVFERGETFGELESRRTVSELLAPVSGKVTAINTDLADSPTLVNDDPHEDGWLVEIDIENLRELEDLLDAEEYEALAED